MPEPTGSGTPAASIPSWVEAIVQELAELAERGLTRRLRRIDRSRTHPARLVLDGRELINFASNDYLGLGFHPRLREAAAQAALEHGTGSGASRLVSGHHGPVQSAESTLARFKHAEAALILPTGYMANLAVVQTLAGPGAEVFFDKLDHASLIDAARASGGRARSFPHRNLARLEVMLQRSSASGRKIILTDSVFSMDGDVADLPGLLEIARRYEAILVVDEAHGTGILGEEGSGLAELQGVAAELAREGVTVSTASKALGGLGGMVTGPEPLIRLLVHRARPLIFTTAIPPSQAAAIEAAINVIEQEPWRRQVLADLTTRLRSDLLQRGWTLPTSYGDPPVPILPLIVGDNAKALRLADWLCEQGCFAPAIRPPAVPAASSRVRITLRADHQPEDIKKLLAALDAFPG
ncbi:MAG: 8-amino-7-oxononanoate synthase [Phycisphaeraceae bacterium]|nr:8-amino-7-oxononanoate synthase [Phycisphaeraceae bacterium]